MKRLLSLLLALAVFGALPLAVAEQEKVLNLFT